MGKKDLSYPIKKKTEGIYYELVFTASPSSVARISRAYQISGSIMRVLIDIIK